jgi:hypothetical protein
LRASAGCDRQSGYGYDQSARGGGYFSHGGLNFRFAEKQKLPLFLVELRTRCIGHPLVNLSANVVIRTERRK